MINIEGEIMQKKKKRKKKNIYKMLILTMIICIIVFVIEFIYIGYTYRDKPIYTLCLYEEG